MPLIQLTLMQLTKKYLILVDLDIEAKYFTSSNYSNFTNEILNKK